MSPFLSFTVKSHLPAKILIAGIDIVVLVLSLWFSYVVRFDFEVPIYYMAQLNSVIIPVVLTRFLLLYGGKVYSRYWKFFSLNDFFSLYKNLCFGTAFFLTLSFLQSNIVASSSIFLLLLNAVRIKLKLSWPKPGRLLFVITLLLSLSIASFALFVFTVLDSSPVLLKDIPIIGSTLEVERSSAHDVPRSIIILELTFNALLLSIVRIIPRFFIERVKVTATERRILIYGAGSKGEYFLRYLRSTKNPLYLAVGFIDDDINLHHRQIHEVPILGGKQYLTQDIADKEIDEIVLTVRNISDKNLRDIARICAQKNWDLKILPEMSAVLQGKADAINLEVVDIAQLLGRSEVTLSDPGVREYISGKVVLVTGAGGSIGSELCRQISELGPKCLILLGRGENSIYQIHNELMASSIEFPCVCVIANVCDKNRIDAIVGRYLPEVVFHAAAHKHVPYMESDPEEAVINNVFGSRNMCEISKKYGVKTFVLISTDKAVALSSVMGATKRLAELIVQKESTDSDTRFVTVRFGNVLGSRGSVVPLFEKQIRSGGPVTVTHQEMNRYFMSIPEAVRLVLHSGNCANNGELCVLDMGKPVPIVDLAENMIAMFGKRPYEDIDIVFTGLRPGEVLSEELFTQDELKVTRTIDKINICQPAPDHIPDSCWSKLYAAASAQDKGGTIAIISDLLPGFQRK